MFDGITFSAEPTLPFALVYDSLVVKPLSRHVVDVLALRVDIALDKTIRLGRCWRDQRNRLAVLRDLVLDAIRSALEVRERVRLLKADIAVRKAFAGQSEPFFDDGLADVLVGGIGAISDFAAVSLLAGQATSQPIPDNSLHPDGRLPAIFVGRFRSVHAFEANCDASDNDSVAVFDISRPFNRLLDGQVKRGAGFPSALCRRTHS